MFNLFKISSRRIPFVQLIQAILCQECDKLITHKNWPQTLEKQTRFTVFFIRIKAFNEKSLKLSIVVQFYLIIDLLSIELINFGVYIFNFLRYLFYKMMNQGMGSGEMGFNRWGKTGGSYQNMTGYKAVDYSGGWNANSHDQMLNNNIDYIYQKFDTNCTGQLEGTEFFNAYSDLCLNMGLSPPQSYQEVSNAILSADANFNGRVSKMEMFRLFKMIQGIKSGGMMNQQGMGGGMMNQQGMGGIGGMNANYGY